MTDETCEECGRQFTDDHEAFRDQWKPGRRELCMPIQSFGGYQLCAERTAERLKLALAERDKRIAELEAENAMLRDMAAMGLRLAQSLGDSDDGSSESKDNKGRP